VLERALEHASFAAVVDRFLAGPVMHELVHFDRAREGIFPGVLDECVAGWLTVRLVPGFAFRDDGEGAVFAAPWFAQVGLALERAVGLAPLVRGELPARLAEPLARMGWADLRARRPLHFLSDPYAPQPWLSAILDGARDPSPLDARIAGEALRAMCLRHAIVDHHHVVTAAPPELPIVIDFDAGDCSRAARDGDPASPWHWFPRRPGRGRQAVELAALEQIEALASDLIK
jgi:hypothetical protein